MQDTQPQKKKVSVVLPVHNEEKWLEECVMSLVEGTYENIEIIIVDDGSQDSTLALAHRIQEKWGEEKILVYHFDTTGGEGRIRSKGVELAHGEYIMESDADALFPKDFIEASVLLLEKSGADGVSLGYLKVHPKRKGILANYWRAKRLVSYMMRSQGRKGPVIGMYLFKRSVIDTIGAYDPHFFSAADFDFAMRAQEVGITSVWAQDIFFYHADETRWGKFFLRLLRGAYYDAPARKKWGMWLSVPQQIKEVAHALVSYTFILLALTTPLHGERIWFLIFILFFEGFLPLFLHEESRRIAIVCIQKGYWGTFLTLPLITTLRVRGGNTGKTLAVLFPRAFMRRKTFDV